MRLERCESSANGEMSEVCMLPRPRPVDIGMCGSSGRSSNSAVDGRTRSGLAEGLNNSERYAVVTLPARSVSCMVYGMNLAAS